MNIFRVFTQKNKIKRSIREANEMRDLTGKRYYVFMLGKKVMVIPKQDIKRLLAMHKFAKGITIADIEKKCIHITN